jgi:hypothetical protein
MIIRKNKIAGREIMVGDIPTDMARRDRREEQKDRLLVNRSRALTARGGRIMCNGKAIWVIAGGYRSIAV